LVQGWALTNLWLSLGDLPRANESAEAFLAGATATAERTWQALAWDANARVALRSNDTLGAQRRVENAIAALEGFEAPVAAWQVHATAADVARARGDSTAASRHRSTSRSIIDALADSFGADNRAQRQTFLDSPAVARVFDGSTDE
jgi:hypothetical protein